MSRPPTLAAFKAATDKLFDETCTECHSSPDPEAGFDLNKFRSVESLAADRDQWELVLYKLKAREMPPAEVERPDAHIETLVKFLEAEFARADANLKPDPGRVTARRLNRAEYTNTIRDLLAVEFRADRNFPTDDSGEGFDNIGDVLTVSPVLMDKYLSAASSIAERAVGATPLPKPIEVEYSLRFKNLRRLDPSNVEASHRFDFDAEYELRIGLPGQRPEDAKPVQLGLWLDGKLIHTKLVETKPSGLVYFNPYSEEKIRVSLPEGDHKLRLGFIDDAFVKTLAKQELFTDKVNKWIGSMTIVGPYPSTAEKPSRKLILVCDPNTGSACVDRIVSTLARRAYRRPVSRIEVASLKKFVAMAQADGLTVEQGIGVAIQAMLVSPHFLFHIERDLYPNDPTRVHRISDIELASRLSYFLWNSMPDDELLTLAEQKRLSVPSVLDAQMKRMLADPKSFALAENFAGQWLEIRNLDSIKPDPQKFPGWTPELRDAMKTETRMFFDSMLRENRPDQRVRHRAVHVPQRATGQVLRHHRRRRPGVPARGSHDRRARRRARPRQRARRLELSDAHLRGHSGQVHPAEHPGDAAPAAADGRPGARRGRRGHDDVASPADGEAPDELDLRVLPQPDGPARLRPRELRRDRQVANAGRQLPGGCQRRAAERQGVHRPGRDAQDSRRHASRSVARADREAADLQPRPWSRALRPPDGADHHEETG